MYWLPKDTVTLEIVHRLPFMCSVTNPIFRASAHAESIVGWGESAASAACLQQMLLHKKHFLPCKRDQWQKERYCIVRESTWSIQRIAHLHLQLRFSSDTGSLAPSCNTWRTYCPKPTWRVATEDLVMGAKLSSAPALGVVSSWESKSWSTAPGHSPCCVSASSWQPQTLWG